MYKLDGGLGHALYNKAITYITELSLLSAYELERLV